MSLEYTTSINQWRNDMLFGKTLKQHDLLGQIDSAKRLLPTIEFAWYPIRLNNDNNTNGQWLWLEKYISAGIDRSAYIKFNNLYYKTIKRIKINSIKEDMVNRMDGIYTDDYICTYSIKTSALLDKQVGLNDNDLLSLNFNLVIDPWLCARLRSFIIQKENKIKKLLKGRSVVE